jgi:Mn-dependent DtxR family transcriptional regulator
MMNTRTENMEPERLTSSNEDYIEAIYVLGNYGTTPVRSVDLAARIEVSKASVNKALSNLKAAGMVEQPHYGDITMTDKGREYARSVLDRHHVLYHFLLDVLGVEPATAVMEACKMEHAISDGTLSRWTDYMMSLPPRGGHNPS